MEVILWEIERALRANLYFSAIAVALTLPGICAALESSSGDTKGKDQESYVTWYEQNLSTDFPHLTGVDVYSLRCGVIHQGRFGHAKSQYSRVIFTLPVPQIIVCHNNIVGDALNLDAETFCRVFASAARKWFLLNQNNNTVEKNYKRFVQYRMNGMPPYLVGLPVIS